MRHCNGAGTSASEWMAGGLNSPVSWRREIEVNFEELARCTDDFNGAQLKAVCVEAGMLALRRDATTITHEGTSLLWDRTCCVQVVGWGWVCG